MFKWLSAWKDASVDHHTAEWLSNHKGFQKFVLGIYNTPAKIIKKIEALDEKNGEDKKGPSEKEEIRLLSEAKKRNTKD